MRWIVAGAAAALAGGCITIQVPAPAPPAGSGGSNGSSPVAVPVTGGASGQRAVDEMVALVNAHRRTVQCPELAWMQPVAAAAQAHSDDMARRGYFNHRSPE